MKECFPYVVPLLRAQEGKKNDKRQDKVRQDMTKQDKTRQDMTRQDKTRQDMTKQDKTIQEKKRLDKIPCCRRRWTRRHRMKECFPYVAPLLRAQEGKKIDKIQDKV
jgi:hypothetical protein